MDVGVVWCGVVVSVILEGGLAAIDGETLGVINLSEPSSVHL